MENRYLKLLERDHNYAPLLELREIYVEVIRNNMARNRGRLDDEGRIIGDLFKRVNDKINKRLSLLEKLAKSINLTSEAA